MITFYEVYTLDLRCKTEAQVKRQIMGYFMCCSGAKVHSFIAVAMKEHDWKGLDWETHSGNKVGSHPSLYHQARGLPCLTSCAKWGTPKDLPSPNHPHLLSSQAWDALYSVCHDSQILRSSNSDSNTLQLYTLKLCFKLYYVKTL